MKVLIVNTSERTGGAAVAASRLMEALNNNGVKAKMLVRDKQTDAVTVAALPGRWRQQWNFLWERWCLLWHLRGQRRYLFKLDMGNAGSDITRLPEFKEADVVHLHWVNQGMLSLQGIRRSWAARTTRRSVATASTCRVRAAATTSRPVCGGERKPC